MYTLAPHTFPTPQELQKMLGFSVGFDGFFNRLSNMDMAQSGYPPYNIRKINEFQYVVELALAGFSKSDIEVEVTDGTLTIRSVTAKGDPDGVDNDEKSSNNEIGFVHQGIAKRSFQRQFNLSDDIIVKSADFTDGMLIVNLERVIPDEKKPRLIPIS